MTRLRQALSVLENLDCNRHLPRGIAILLFVVAAALGVRGFFLISDLTLWGEPSELFALFITAVSWVAIFPIWILSYVLLMVLLNAVGITDLRSEARNRLAGLRLSLEELRDLHDAVAARQWRHTRVFQGALIDLANAQSSR